MFIRQGCKPNSAKPFSGGATLALCNHNYDEILGTTANGTLKSTADDYGLAVEVDPCDTSYARDMCALVARGDVDGMSFGMLMANAKWALIHGETDGEPDIWEFSEFEFDEVSFTGIPAFTGTSAQVDEADADGVQASRAETQPAAANTPKRNALAVEIAELDWELANMDP